MSHRTLQDALAQCITLSVGRTLNRCQDRQAAVDVSFSFPFLPIGAFPCAIGSRINDGITLLTKLYNQAILIHADPEEMW